LQEVKAEIQDAIDKAKASPEPPMSELYTNIYKGEAAAVGRKCIG
jgi:TPP-dependent pyruvate/acetoin dehydrogenase alpha subunit